MLAHKATKEGVIAAEVIAGHKSTKDWVAIPAAIFTDPEIGSVGLSEDRAREKGIDVRIGKTPVQRAWARNGCNGDGRICQSRREERHARASRVHIVGPSATDLISEAALALEMHAFAEDIALTIHPHPTLGESLMEACEHALGHAIHVLNR